MMQEKDAENTERVMKGHWRGRAGWGARIRTWEWRNQNPLPYHLATPQRPPASGGGNIMGWLGTRHWHGAPPSGDTPRAYCCGTAARLGSSGGQSQQDRFHFCEWAGYQLRYPSRRAVGETRNDSTFCTATGGLAR